MLPLWRRIPCKRLEKTVETFQKQSKIQKPQKFCITWSCKNNQNRLKYVKTQVEARLEFWHWFFIVNLLILRTGTSTTHQLGESARFEQPPWLNQNNPPDPHRVSASRFTSQISQIYSPIWQQICIRFAAPAVFVRVWGRAPWRILGVQEEVVQVRCTATKHESSS